MAVDTAAQPASSRRHHAVFHELRVAAIEPLTEDSVAITFAVPEELREEYDFACGQHLSMRLRAAGDDTRRSYSICTPAGSGRLTVGVKLLEGGVFSTYATTRLQPGDAVEVMTPAGRFGVSLDPSASRSHVAIAAGSGITPILSIIATTLAVEPRSRVALIYGNRTSRSIMFLEELEDLKNRYPERFTLHHVLSREDQEVELFNGRIDADRLNAFLDALLPVEGVNEWFLCGPAPMVRSARAVLVERGADPRHVHSELFFADTGAGASEPAREETAAAATAGATTVTITLDGRSSTFTMPQRGPSVLDAALTVRDDAPFACKGGVCSTCRARCVFGEVRMDRNWALEESELEAGYVLACQSHPVSDTLTLDFDG